MKKKILVVPYNPRVRYLFSEESKYDLIFAPPEEALMEFISDSYSAVLVFAEYETDIFKESRNALRDIKNAASSDVKIFRLGFLPEREVPGEKYLELPMSFKDESLDEILL